MATPQAFIDTTDLDDLKKPLVRRLWDLARRQPLGTAGAFVVVLMATAAATAGILTPFDPERASLQHMLTPPGGQFLMGTDEFGRDILTRVLYGARTALFIGLVSAFVGATAGLIIGGRRPMMQIQHAGLYASVNNLRGVALDGQFPIVLLIGLLGRDPELEPEEDGSSMVRLCRPLLETLDIPSHLLDGPEDLHHVAEAFDEAAERNGPVALLVGTTTS